MGRTDEVLKAIQEDFSRHLSGVYEKIAVSVLLKHSPKFFPFQKIGRWWDKNEEIDIVGINSSLDSILFGEVKWSTKPVGIDI